MGTATVYCPACGAELVRHAETLWCPSKNQGLSKLVREELEQAVKQRSDASVMEDDLRESVTYEYCPRCATELMVGEKAVRVCPRCGLTLPGGVFHMLREYHEHGFRLRERHTGTHRPS